MRADSDAQRALRQEVVARFETWATGEIERLERKAKKMDERAYPDVAKALRDRAGYVQVILADIKKSG